MASQQSNLAGIGSGDGAPSPPILRLVTYFSGKKFLVSWKAYKVVVQQAKTVKDLKCEIARVYKGVTGSDSWIPVVELQDFYGCSLFDDYPVGSVLRDFAEVYALREGERRNLPSEQERSASMVFGSGYSFPQPGYLPGGLQVPIMPAQQSVPSIILATGADGTVSQMQGLPTFSLESQRRTFPAPALLSQQSDSTHQTQSSEVSQALPIAPSTVDTSQRLPSDSLHLSPTNSPPLIDTGDHSARVQNEQGDSSSTEGNAKTDENEGHLQGEQQQQQQQLEQQQQQQQEQQQQQLEQQQQLQQEQQLEQSETQESSGWSSDSSWDNRKVPSPKKSKLKSQAKSSKQKQSRVEKAASTKSAPKRQSQADSSSPSKLASRRKYKSPIFVSSSSDSNSKAAESDSRHVQTVRASSRKLPTKRSTPASKQAAGTGTGQSKSKKKAAKKVVADDSSSHSNKQKESNLDPDTAHTAGISHKPVEGILGGTKKSDCVSNLKPTGIGKITSAPISGSKRRITCSDHDCLLVAEAPEKLIEDACAVEPLQEENVSVQQTASTHVESSKPVSAIEGAKDIDTDSDDDWSSEEEETGEGLTKNETKDVPARKNESAASKQPVQSQSSDSDNSESSSDESDNEESVDTKATHEPPPVGTTSSSTETKSQPSISTEVETLGNGEGVVSNQSTAQENHSNDQKLITENGGDTTEMTASDHSLLDVLVEDTQDVEVIPETQTENSEEEREPSPEIPLLASNGQNMELPLSASSKQNRTSKKSPQKGKVALSRKVLQSKSVAEATAVGETESDRNSGEEATNQLATETDKHEETKKNVPDVKVKQAKPKHRRKLVRPIRKASQASTKKALTVKPKPVDKATGIVQLSDDPTSKKNVYSLSSESDTAQATKIPKISQASHSALKPLARPPTTTAATRRKAVPQKGLQKGPVLKKATASTSALKASTTDESSESSEEDNGQHSTAGGQKPVIHHKYLLRKGTKKSSLSTLLDYGDKKKKTKAIAPAVSYALAPTQHRFSSESSMRLFTHSPRTYSLGKKPSVLRRQQDGSSSLAKKQKLSQQPAAAELNLSTLSQEEVEYSRNASQNLSGLLDDDEMLW